MFECLLFNMLYSRWVVMAEEALLQFDALTHPCHTLVHLQQWGCMEQLRPFACCVAALNSSNSTHTHQPVQLLHAAPARRGSHVLNKG